MGQTFLVTGAAGFIGSHFVDLVLKAGQRVLSLDCLTYAGNKKNLEAAFKNSQFTFVEGNILDSKLVSELLRKHRITALVNFAAESHVDRSISGPSEFMQTNIMGVYELLRSSHEYFKTLSPTEQKRFRFLQVSTDEVFGSLNQTGFFSEETPYQPNSPYSASKASADHLVRAWHHTFKLPTVITHCSNNYGPRQYPEKLIPLMIRNAVSGKGLPVYGTGENIRDWIHVEDHARGVYLALTKGTPGAHYCFGGASEKTNLWIVNELCRLLDQKKPKANGKKYSEQIQFVEDRLGHDFRYAIDFKLATKELGFKPEYEFAKGLEQTLDWYLERS